MTAYNSNSRKHHSPDITITVQQKRRTLSELEQAFLEELRLYDKLIETTRLISWNQHGIDADGRGLRAARIFTRQTVVGLSMQKLLPRPSPTTHHEDELWDVVSIASLSRNLLEGYLSLYYFGIEMVSAEEAELRFLIAQLHQNVEWCGIRKLTDPNDPKLNEFERGISGQRARIREHPFLSSLTMAQRGLALRGLEMYKTKTDFENEVPVCKDLRRNFRHLSNLVHPLPMSIERIDNDRGRGIGSDPDVNYCLICLMLARKYLAASTVGFADLFPNHFASKCRNALDSIRPLTSVGFNE